MELKIERPIKFNLSMDKLQQVLEFFGHFGPSIDKITEIVSTLSNISSGTGKYLGTVILCDYEGARKDFLSCFAWFDVNSST